MPTRNNLSYIDLSLIEGPPHPKDDSSLQIRRMLLQAALAGTAGAHLEPLTIEMLRPKNGGWVFAYPNFPGENITFDRHEPATWQFFTPVFNIIRPGECWHFLGYCNGKDKNIRPICAIERYTPDLKSSFGEISRIWARQVSTGQLEYLDLARLSNEAWLKTL